MPPKKQKLTLTNLDEAMLRHMAYNVQVEHRPFSYLDFETFEVDGRNYSVSHGTCRNKFSKFIKMGLIQLEYNSKISHSTLSKDITFVKDA